MKEWNLFPTIAAPMPYQMALDELLFKKYFLDSSSSQKPLLRFFYASEPSVTVGFSYRGFDSKDPAICRRITGGGKVEHGKDLIFSLIARKDHDESFKSVRISYWKIHEAIRAGFALYERDFQFYRCDEELPKGSECFHFPIATDLAYQKKKIAGGAQKRSGGAMLHEESIQRPGNMEDESMEEAVRKGFEKIFEIEWIPCHVRPEDLKAAYALSKSK